MTTSRFYQFGVRRLGGGEETLDFCRGKVSLLVNVASECGFTRQYAGLEALYRRFRDQGLLVLGFPCDQFGHQEPGNADRIQSFCTVNFGVTFPLFAKIDVNGPRAHPLFTWLKSERRGFLGTRSIKWNFTKFLVDRNGEVRHRFGARDTPEGIEPRVRGLLAYRLGETMPVRTA